MTLEELEALAEQPAQQCRTDGRCQYAIDSGAEGMGHCPKGKCVMPAQQEPVAWLTGCPSCGMDSCDCDDGTWNPPAQRKPPSGWVAVSDRIPLESDGEVLVRMRDGRCEIAWATYWHGASNAFAQWTFRDPDEDEAPTHWMLIPAIEAAHGVKRDA